MPNYQTEPLLCEKIDDLMKMCEVEFVSSRDTPNGSKDFEKNLSNLKFLLKTDINHKMQESEMDLALGCLNASIIQLKLLNSGLKDFEVSKYSLEQYLRLDIAAIKALNVFPQNNDVVAGSAGSLFGLLNQCKT